MTATDLPTEGDVRGASYVSPHPSPPPMAKKRRVAPPGSSIDDTISCSTNRRRKVDKPRFVCFLDSGRASQLHMTTDCLGLKGEKGYRLARASHSLSFGAWYYELTINSCGNIEAPSASAIPGSIADVGGQCRVGWATDRADLQRPCGVDVYSWSVGSLTGAKFHESRGSPCLRRLVSGDVIGLYAFVPEPAAKRENSSAIVKTENELSIDVSIELGVCLNGEDHGIIFSIPMSTLASRVKQNKDKNDKESEHGEALTGLGLYPAVSLFGPCSVTCQFGPLGSYKFGPPLAHVPPYGFSWHAVSELYIEPPVTSEEDPQVPRQSSPIMTDTITTTTLDGVVVGKIDPGATLQLQDIEPKVESKPLLQEPETDFQSYNTPY